MTSVLMVEDEFMVAKRLSRFIHLAFDKQALKFKHCVSLEDAQDYLASNSIDVLFLDLNLQGSDGFTLLKQQLCESFHTIVVSANSDRAIEAFDLGVLDFVAKPFTQQRIQKAVDRLGQIANTHIKFLPYKHLGNIELLPIEQIHYIKADGHYSLVNSGANKEILHD